MTSTTDVRTAGAGEAARGPEDEREHEDVHEAGEAARGPRGRAARGPEDEREHEDEVATAQRPVDRS